MYKIRSWDEAVRPMTVYVCVTDTYWGNNCDSWGAVGWNTGGTNWGYKPENAQNRKDKNGKSLLDRMTINKHTDQPYTKEFRLTIENPSPEDSGTYVLGLWWGSGTVPLNVLPEHETCVLSLFTKTTTNYSLCEHWKKRVPHSH